MAGVSPSAGAGVGGEAMESILVGGERAKNGGDADEARSAAATDHRCGRRSGIGCPPLCLSGMTSFQGQTLNKHAD
jgi:hypothetical protein